MPNMIKYMKKDENIILKNTLKNRSNFKVLFAKDVDYDSSLTDINLNGRENNYTSVTSVNGYNPNPGEQVVAIVGKRNGLVEILGKSPWLVHYE